ncbi:MAG: NupC/NupG family nucleoside CNT transporter, partial [Arenimonas sp.]|nr:NupC/NupG family nucleoside CNT transporter [Arenimonas sp.]
MSAILFGLFGLCSLLAIAWLFSNNKRRVDWRLVVTGVVLQIAFAYFVLLTDSGSAIFEGLGKLFVTLINFTNEGSKMILGGFADQDKYGFVFIFHALPTVIFFASFMAVLYHLGVMQWIVKIMALAITKLMRVSGAETTSVCASVFIGQTEAPLTVRPYIGRMTDSELLTMMIGGMAHIAG